MHWSADAFSGLQCRFSLLLLVSPSPSSPEAAPEVSSPSPAAEVSPAPAPGGLRAQDGALAPARRARVLRALLLAHVLEHGRVLEHVGQDQEADLGAADVDVLHLGDATVAVGGGHLEKGGAKGTGKRLRTRRTKQNLSQMSRSTRKRDTLQND